MRKSLMPPELLLYGFYHAVANEVNYPHNKRYNQERRAYERELIDRLGGDWKAYCGLDEPLPASKEDAE